MPVRNVRAEMGGTVIEIGCSAGASVSEEDTLLIMEAMKIEMAIVAPVAGRVRDLRVAIGDVVQEDQVLAVIEY
jgi:biotin carboxyl carrier protein